MRLWGGVGVEGGGIVGFGGGGGGEGRDGVRWVGRWDGFRGRAACYGLGYLANARLLACFLWMEISVLIVDVQLVEIVKELLHIDLRYLFPVFCLFRLSNARRL